MANVATQLNAYLLWARLHAFDSDCNAKRATYGDLINARDRLGILVTARCAYWAIAIFDVSELSDATRPGKLAISIRYVQIDVNGCCIPGDDQLNQAIRGTALFIDLPIAVVIDSVEALFQPASNTTGREG